MNVVEPILNGLINLGLLYPLLCAKCYHNLMLTDASDRHAVYLDYEVQVLLGDFIHRGYLSFKG